MSRVQKEGQTAQRYSSQRSSSPHFLAHFRNSKNGTQDAGCQQIWNEFLVPLSLVKFAEAAWDHDPQENLKSVCFTAYWGQSEVDKSWWGFNLSNWSINEERRNPKKWGKTCEDPTGYPKCSWTYSTGALQRIFSPGEHGRAYFQHSNCTFKSEFTHSLFAFHWAVFTLRSPCCLIDRLQ